MNDTRSTAAAMTVDASPVPDHSLAVLPDVMTPEALEARIKRRRIIVVWMRIAAKAVGLPDQYPAAAHRRTGPIHNPAGDTNDLALSLTGPPGDAREIIALCRFAQWIERAQDLVRCPRQQRRAGRTWRSYGLHFAAPSADRVLADCVA